MKRFIIYTLFICAAFSTLAQGWQYDDDKSIIVSSPELSSDNELIMLGLVAAEFNNSEHVLLYLNGAVTRFALRDNQQYIVASFYDGKKSSKWAVKSSTIKGQNILAITNASKFIDRLCTSDMFSITLPIEDMGVTTFTFISDGYPLDW